MTHVVLTNLQSITGDASSIVNKTLTSAANIEERLGIKTSMTNTYRANVYVVSRFLRWRGQTNSMMHLPVAELWRDALVAATLATSMARIIRACVFLQSSGADIYDRNAIHDAIHVAASASNAIASHRLRRNRKREGTIDDMCVVGGKHVEGILKNVILIRPDGMTETDSEGNHLVSETVCIAADEIMRIVSESVPNDFS